MPTPLEYAERYWQLAVPVPNDSVTVRIDKYHLGSPTHAKDVLWAKLHDHFTAQQRQTPGFRLGLTVDGQPVEFGSTQEMLFHVLRPFFGKGSPEQNQIVLQLVVLLNIKTPAELQAYANENLGIDCNGFVGNYLLHGKGQQPWTVLDGAGSAVGPNSLITQIFAQGHAVTNGGDMFPARSYILVEVDAHGHVMPGGPSNPPGHIAITEPGRFQSARVRHGFVRGTRRGSRETGRLSAPGIPGRGGDRQPRRPHAVVVLDPRDPRSSGRVPGVPREPGTLSQVQDRRAGVRRQTASSPESA